MSININKAKARRFQRHAPQAKNIMCTCGHSQWRHAMHPPQACAMCSCVKLVQKPQEQEDEWRLTEVTREHETYERIIDHYIERETHFLMTGAVRVQWLCHLCNMLHATQEAARDCVKQCINAETEDE